MCVCVCVCVCAQFIVCYSLVQCTWKHIVCRQMQRRVQKGLDPLQIVNRVVAQTRAQSRLEYGGFEFALRTLEKFSIYPGCMHMALVMGRMCKDVQA